MRFRDIDTVINKTCAVLNGIAGVILSLLVIWLVLNIFGRLFKMPITGTYEAVQYGFCLTVCFAIACTAVHDKHIYIELIFKRYPQKIRHVIEIIGSLFGIFIFTVVTWRCYVNGVEGLIINEKSSTLGMPIYFFQFAMAFGFAMLTVVILLKLLKEVGVGQCHQ